MHKSLQIIPYSKGAVENCDIISIGELFGEVGGIVWGYLEWFLDCFDIFVILKIFTNLFRNFRRRCLGL